MVKEAVLLSRERRLVGRVIVVVRRRSSVLGRCLVSLVRRTGVSVCIRMLQGRFRRGRRRRRAMLLAGTRWVIGRLCLFLIPAALL